MYKHFRLSCSWETNKLPSVHPTTLKFSKIFSRIIKRKLKFTILYQCQWAQRSFGVRARAKLCPYHAGGWTAQVEPLSNSQTSWPTWTLSTVSGEWMCWEISMRCMPIVLVRPELDRHRSAGAQLNHFNSTVPLESGGDSWEQGVFFIFKFFLVNSREEKVRDKSLSRASGSERERDRLADSPSPSPSLAVSNADQAWDACKKSPSLSSS